MPRSLKLLSLVLMSALVGGCSRGGSERSTGGGGREGGEEAEQPNVPAAADPVLPGLAESTDGGRLERELRDMWAAKGAGYEARTRHLRPDGTPEYVNRLIGEQSPYLLQHAHNPVNWFPWGDEVFERAKRENKPVLLSVGYSTCHWCHVMEHESFEDEEVAAFINEHYLPVKVDREERPDVDQVYMRAVHLLMDGRGGWPMTVLLTPDRTPFFAATYLPARDGDRGRGKGLLTVLDEMRAEFNDSQSEVVARAAELSEKIARQNASTPAGQLPSAGLLDEATSRLARSFDETHGGFGRAPKFPRPMTLDLLLRRATRTGDEELARWALETLDAILRGGIHDHVGGGFHRYAVDERWLVPHFEKMLYDNAQLAAVLVLAWQQSGDARYRSAAVVTLRYLEEEMHAPDGGYYSATDADSETPQGHREEGWFFTWTPAEIEAAVGKELARSVRAYYDVTGRGNLDGRNVLHAPRSLDDAASELGLERARLEAQLETARGLLDDARAQRPPPLRDEKVLTSWNGLVLVALARAGFAFDDDAMLERARSLAETLLQHHRDEQGRLLRQRSGGRAFLDDHAFLIDGLLELHDATSERRWLEAAIELQGQQDDYHYDSVAGGYYTSASDGEALLTREKPIYDGAEPSGNSVAVRNLLRLHALTDRREYRERAEMTLRFAGTRLSRNPTGSPAMLTGLDFALDTPMSIFVVAEGSPESALVNVLRETMVPNAVRAIVSASEVEGRLDLVPGLEGKRPIRGQTTAFVCEHSTCQLPTSDPGVLRSQLAKLSRD